MPKAFCFPLTACAAAVVLVGEAVEEQRHYVPERDEQGRQAGHDAAV
jgi:hypothetical protein